MTRERRVPRLGVIRRCFPDCEARFDAEGAEFIKVAEIGDRA